MRFVLLKCCESNWEATCGNKHYECSGFGNVFAGYQAKCKESN